MGSMVVVTNPRSFGDAPVASRGGVRKRELYGEALMGATYATGGDTLPTPPTISGFTLWAVSILAYERVAGMSLHWNFDTATPKIVAFDEDNASGIEAELANASAALAAVNVKYALIYLSGT